MKDVSATLVNDLNDARQKGAAPAVAAFEAAISDFNVKKENVLQNYIQMRRDLAAKKRSAIEKIQM